MYRVLFLDLIFLHKKALLISLADAKPGAVWFESSSINQNFFRQSVTAGTNKTTQRSCPCPHPELQLSPVNLQSEQHLFHMWHRITDHTQRALPHQCQGVTPYKWGSAWSPVTLFTHGSSKHHWWPHTFQTGATALHSAAAANVLQRSSRHGAESWRIRGHLSWQEVKYCHSEHLLSLPREYTFLYLMIILD